MNFKLHEAVYKFARLALTPITRLALGFRGELAPETAPPYLVVCNHTTDWDPLLLGCCFRRHMYFVASDHVYRNGLSSELLRAFVSPIARAKGSTDKNAAMSILRALKRGNNVCIFAEGDRSWNGATGQIHPTTARLVRLSRVSLITYRIKGGYFTSPRWSDGLRRGSMTGKFVNSYSPELLQSMSDDEIAKAVSRDIFVDAYADQRSSKSAFRGKKLAERLETALYVCPVCHGVCSLKSEGDRFFCGCGYSVRYNEYGFFEGDGAVFKTVAEWDAWQEDFLLKIAEKSDDEPIFSDDCQRLLSINGKSAHIAAEGRLSLYRDRLTLGDRTFKLRDIPQMALFRRDTINFSTRDGSFELTSRALRSARKYVTMFDILKKLEAAGGQ